MDGSRWTSGISCRFFMTVEQIWDLFNHKCKKNRRLKKYTGTFFQLLTGDIE